MIKSDAIQWLKEIPIKNKNREFIIDYTSNTTLTFGELDKNARNIAKFMKNHGLSKGDHVSIMMENSISLVKLYFACLYAGIVVIPINPIMSLQEIEYIINHSKTKMIIVSPHTINKIDLTFLNRKKFKIISISNSDENNFDSNVLCWNLDKISESNDIESFIDSSPDDDMIIVYTSGTTAEPKAVVHRIYDLVNNAKEFGEMIGIDHSNRFYNMLSLTYLGGYFNLLFLPYICESSVVLTDSFDSKSVLNFWEPIIKNNINTLWLVPSIISILLEFDRGNIGQNYCKKNIRFCLCGTAPLPNRLKQDFEKKYGIKIYENFGLTETFFITTNSPKYKNTEQSVGKILSSVKVRIVKKEKEISKNEEGEIQVKTPFLMRGYYNSQEEPNEISIDSWFDTGDLGYISENNELFLTGRKKDLIIRGGVNISPISIENILYKDPAVKECAIIGLPHKFQGEEIVAVISLKNDEDFEDIKLRLFELCKTNLSVIKQPSKIIQLHELPRTTSGKIVKGKIKSWLLSSTKIQPQNIQKHMGTQFTEKLLPHSTIVEKSIQALSIKFNTMVYEMQQKGEDITVLSLGEAFFDIPLFDFKYLPFPKLYHYSHSRGIPELREKILKYFSENYGVTFDSEKEIIITAGSKIAIHMSLMALINPGDEVIIHEPAWVSFPEQVKLCYGIPIQIPYDKSVYDFEDYISNKTKLIIVNNPNNPTGKVLNLQEMSYLHQLAKKYNLYVLSDEAYSDFVINQDEFISFGNLDIEKTHTIITNSISKNFGISGWRIGYLITNSKLIEQILKINQHLITCPATILEYYIAKYFDEIITITKPQILEVVKKREMISSHMDSLKINYLQGTATFYFFVSIKNSKLSSEEFCLKLLNDYKISTVPGIGYGRSCDKFIRISIGSESTERIKKGIDKINELIKKTSIE